MAAALLATVPALAHELRNAQDDANGELVVVRARLRRVEGVLCVSASLRRLLWSSSSPDATAAQLVAVPADAIARVLVNAATDQSAGALLKLELASASLVFQFASAAPRDEVRAALARAQLSSSSSEAVEQASSDPRLLDDSALRALFTQLVTRGPLSAAEFWTLHRSDASPSSSAAPSSSSSSSSSSAQQQRGLPSTLPSASDAVAPSSESAEHVQYELTPARVHQLFVTYAGLQRAYVRLVPAQMTEEQFWTRFFQSQHYKRGQEARTGTAKRERSEGSADDVFALAQLEAAETQARRDRLQHVLRANDLTQDTDMTSATSAGGARDAETSASDAKLSAREYKRSTRYQQQLDLIRKVNRHAALLVETLAHDEIQMPPTKRARLAQNSEEEAHEVKAEATARAGKTAAASTRPDMGDNDAVEMADAQRLPSSTSTSHPVPRLVWRTPLQPRLSSVRLDLSSVARPSPSSSSNTSHVSELLVRRVHELLRHWWSAKRAQDASKQQRLRPALTEAVRELSAMDKHDVAASELRATLLSALA